VALEISLFDAENMYSPSGRFRMIRVLVFLFLATALDSSLVASDAFQPDLAEFARLVKPYFSSHCIRCHGDAVAESDMRLDVEQTNEKGGVDSSEPKHRH